MGEASKWPICPLPSKSQPWLTRAFLLIWPMNFWLVKFLSPQPHAKASWLLWSLVFNYKYTLVWTEILPYLTKISLACACRQWSGAQITKMPFSRFISHVLFGNLDLLLQNLHIWFWPHFWLYFNHLAHSYFGNVIRQSKPQNFEKSCWGRVGNKNGIFVQILSLASFDMI